MIHPNRHYTRSNVQTFKSQSVRQRPLTRPKQASREVNKDKEINSKLLWFSSTFFILSILSGSVLRAINQREEKANKVFLPYPGSVQEEIVTIPAPQAPQVRPPQETVSISQIVPEPSEITNLFQGVQVQAPTTMFSSTAKTLPGILANSNSQKELAPGVTLYEISKTVGGSGIRAQVIEIDRGINPNLSIKPALAGNRLRQFESTLKMVQRENALAGINSSFFSSEESLGLIKIDNQLINNDFEERAVLAISPTGYMIDRVDTSMSAQNLTTGQTMPIHLLNYKSTENAMYTSAWGSQAPSNFETYVTVRNNIVESVGSSAPSIPQDGYILAGPNSVFGQFQPGHQVNVDIQTTPNIDGYTDAVGAGPFLVKDGQKFVGANEEGLSNIAGKNPRSAVGFSEDGRLYLVAVEGRISRSAGMTFDDLADFMLELGCDYAMGFDGGYSTQMVAENRVVNETASLRNVPVSLIVK